ncbi:MAG: hypothetical protein A3F10_02090 [Coxiella sp. RIFCSPHIGHO2_12_FULL_42_15]|nr:MAG: hypothetical protein A3F10_02090 [Coxiella sp. RIFCSPHIGHO2_12_FULL_42_15]
MRRFKLMSIALVAVFAVHLAHAAPEKSALPVHINQADQKQLIALKGIGKKRAQAIIVYRQGHGKFHAMQDLLAVPGMTQKLLDKIEKQNGSRAIFD